MVDLIFKQHMKICPGKHKSKGVKFAQWDVWVRRTSPPTNGCFQKYCYPENPIKIDDLGVPLFLEIPK